MKTKIKLLLILIYLFFITFIGESGFSLLVSGGEENFSGFKKIPINIPNGIQGKANKLNYIDVRFCNNGLEKENLIQNLSMVARPGEEKEFCIIIFNRDSIDHDLWYGFTKGVGEGQNTNCDVDYAWTNSFGKFIKPFDKETITVPALGSIIKKTTLKFPAYINGMQKGCFAYGVVGDGKISKSGGFVLNFINRKINFINVLIKGEQYTIIEKIKHKLTKNKNIIMYTLFLLVLFLLIFEIKKNRKHIKKRKCLI